MASVEEVRSRFQRVSERAFSSGPVDAGGGGPHDSGVEQQLAQLHTDVRDLLKAGLGGFVLVFTAIVVAFFFLIAKIDGVSNQVSAVATDVAVLKSDVATLKAAKPDAPQAQTP